MSLNLNSDEARKADNFSSVIKETNKYVGTITRAEKLLSKNNVEGLGLSFKTDDGASANYLDIYTVKPGGVKLQGYNLVQAILCCIRTKQANEGSITFFRWDRDERRMVQVVGVGYPDLMGKRIGLILQRELTTHSITGEDAERLNIVAVFEAKTGLTSSEILDGKTKPEKIDFIARAVMNNPVRDTRKRAPIRQQPSSQQPEASTFAFDDDIPF